eukprot:1355342-Pleurochrysis_carterae.AAC.1
MAESAAVAAVCTAPSSLSSQARRRWPHSAAIAVVFTAPASLLSQRRCRCLHRTVAVFTAPLLLVAQRCHRRCIHDAVIKAVFTA